MSLDPDQNSRYEVTYVWGCMRSRVKVGEVCVDFYKGEPDAEWHIMHTPTGEIIGGFVGRYLGERTEAESA